MNARLNYLAKGESYGSEGKGREGIVGPQSAAAAPLLWILPGLIQSRVAFNNCLYQSDATFFLHFPFAPFKYSKRGKVSIVFAVMLLLPFSLFLFLYIFTIDIALAIGC